jgi:hypothetical protein
MTDPRAQNAIEYIQEQVEQLELRLRELKLSANSLARTAGLPPVYLEVEGREPRRAPATQMVVEKPIEPDQFATSASSTMAARSYLGWRGRALGAASLDEICSALVKGGFPGATEDDESRQELRLALGKETEIVRLKNGYYVLAAWLKRDRTKTPVTGSWMDENGPRARRGR